MQTHRDTHTVRFFVGFCMLSSLKTIVTIFISCILEWFISFQHELCTSLTRTQYVQHHKLMDIDRRLASVQNSKEKIKNYIWYGGKGDLLNAYMLYSKVPRAGFMNKWTRLANDMPKYTKQRHKDAATLFNDWNCSPCFSRCDGDNKATVEIIAMTIFPLKYKSVLVSRGRIKKSTEIPSYKKTTNLNIFSIDF